MPKITRKFQRIFCGDVPANNVVAQFGSLKAGSPTYSSDPTVVQQLAAWGAGWSGATVTNSAPALQDMNSLFYVLSRQLGYLMQTGIPEYDATTIYYIGSLVYDGTNSIYRCLADDTTGILLSDTTKWVLEYSSKIITVSGAGSLAYDASTVLATGAASYAITIPAASANNTGRRLNIISNMTAGVLTIAPASGTIAGLADLKLVIGQSVILKSSGGTWQVESKTLPYSYENEALVVNNFLSSGTISNIIRAVGLAYLSPNGNWRLKFNCTFEVTGSVGTNIWQFDIDGVTFKNITDYNQAVSSASVFGQSSQFDAFTLPNTETIKFWSSGSGALNGVLEFSGDVELESKPTWAP